MQLARIKVRGITRENCSSSEQFSLDCSGEEQLKDDPQLVPNKNGLRITAAGCLLAAQGSASRKFSFDIILKNLSRISNSILSCATGNPPVYGAFPKFGITPGPLQQRPRATRTVPESESFLTQVDTGRRSRTRCRCGQPNHALIRKLFGGALATLDVP
jgi:hypothetical protein